jgi:hypothetical protein
VVDKKFRASLEITGDTTGLAQSLKRTGQNLKTVGDLMSQFARRAAVAGAAVNAAFAGMAIAGAKTADALAKQARQFDISVESYQNLGFAAQQSGSNAQTMGTSLRRLTQSAFDAQRGIKESADAFKAMGISVADSSGTLKKSEVLFLEVADSLREMEDTTARAALATRLLGRGGTQLTSLFLAGSEGIKAYQRQLEIVGVSQGSVLRETTALGEMVVDSFGLVKQSVIGVQQAMLRALGPSIEKLANLLAVVIGRITEWIDANPELVRQIAKIAAGIGVATAALLALSQGIAAAGALFSGLATFMAGPFLLPFLGVAAVVAALIGLILTFNKTLDDFLDRLTTASAILLVMGKVTAVLNRNFLGAEELVRWGELLEERAKQVQKFRGQVVRLGDVKEKLKELNDAIAAVQGISVEGGAALNDLGDGAEKAANAVERLIEKVKQLQLAPMLAELEDFLNAGGQLDTSAIKALGDLFEAASKQDVNSREAKTAADEIQKALDKRFTTIQVRGINFNLPLSDFELALAKLNFTTPELPITQETLNKFREFDEEAAEVNRRMEEMRLKALGINNVLQLIAFDALAQFGNAWERVAQIVFDSLLSIGDAAGNLLEQLLGVGDPLAALSEKAQIERLKANLAETTEEQEKWTAAAEATERQMDKVRLAVLENQSTFSKFFSSLRKWFAQLIADIGASIAKLVIMRAIMSALNFSLPVGLGNITGSVVPLGATPGGGGTPLNFGANPLGITSSSFGEADTVLTEFGEGPDVPPPTVNDFRGAIFAGDSEGSFREAARRISEAQRFNETGKTI